ncbi:RING/FYVE/PHD zinc finger superfamily protein [Euphorbia peplus]|nr:RING/FYVE/PHD zinc finger superfamily protein [Euphorbia peplus]
MCQHCSQESDIGSRECATAEVKNADYSCLSSCAASPQLSTVSIMSESHPPSFTYLRRKQQEKSVIFSSAEAPGIPKRSGEDCISFICSDAPSVAVRELHVASESERANENPLMPSVAVNKEPAVCKSESINECSPVNEQGSDRISNCNGKHIVYRRTKPRGRYFSAEAPSLSVVSSDSPSGEVKDVASQSDHSHLDTFVPFTVQERGNHVVEELESNEASKSKRQRTIEVDSINESWSSSKSDAELVSASMQTETDDSVECSSSSVTARECSDEGMSEQDVCISLLRSQGVIDGTSPSRNCASAEVVRDSSTTGTSRLCKICSRSNSTLKMLICDICEEAFHLSCCNPRVRKIPVDEWFCHSCSKKRCKILNETISISCAIGEKGRSVSSSTEESNPILLMLRDTGPYSSGVRCGKGFQAEVPEWSGPITNDINKILEPLEMKPSDLVSSDLNFNERSKLSCIGNWLQCRQAIDGAGESDNGAICGKWRRAPLFEVQTDKWECFCSVGWDPIRADCAVPQELETDEILRQLKYIRTLRPRLNVKRRKMERREMQQRNPAGIIMYRRYTHGRNKQ